jgi:hypothetical protein
MEIYTEKENIFYLMMIFTKDSFIMEKQITKDCINRNNLLYPEILRTIARMETLKSPLAMAINIKENLRKAKCMAKESIYTMMEPSIRVTFISELCGENAPFNTPAIAKLKNMKAKLAKVYIMGLVYYIMPME